MNLIDGTKVQFADDRIVLLLPVNQQQAWTYVMEEFERLVKWAGNCGKDKTEVRYKNCGKTGFQVLAAMDPDRAQEQPSESESESINSWGESSIAADASYLEVMDFVAGRQAEGLIVTIMAMQSDRFLFVNGAQVTDRGGNAETWIGVDAKSLVWWRSLTGTLPGRDRGVNYYARLYELLLRDRHIPEYQYCVTRPNGDLHRDVSSYYLIDNYLGVPARIAVSRVGESELVESCGG